MTAFYRHDGFVYRHPGERGDFDRVHEIEIWNGHAWELVTDHDVRTLAMWEGMPITETEAYEIASDEEDE